VGNSVKREKKLRSKRENWQAPVFAFTALFLIAFLFSDSFRTSRNLVNLLVQVAPLALLTIGQTFVILTGGIDLSIGSFVSLATTIAATTMAESSIAISLLLIYGVGLSIGLLNGFAVSYLQMNPFVTTLATMVIVQGLTLHILPAPGGVVPYEYVKVIMYTRMLNMPVFVWLSIGVSIIMMIVLYKTKFGLNLYAVGGNKLAAVLSGVRVRQTLVLAYIMSSLMATTAGVMMVARISCGDPLVGQPYTLDSIGAAAVGGVSLAGGRGGLIGGLIGAFIIGSISNILNMLGVTPYWQFVLKSLIIVAAIGFAIRIKLMQGAREK